MTEPHGFRPGQPDPSARPASLSAEHDWAAAATVIVPVLRPAGTLGRRAGEMASPTAGAGDTQPLIDSGPCGLVIAYAIPVGRFAVIASGDHVAAWGVPIAEVRAAAMRNLTAWSAVAPWTDEVAGARRIRSSATGAGPDAARILLPEVRAELAAFLGAGPGRLLIGLPDQHLLVAGVDHAEDGEFGSLLAGFVEAFAAGADEPIEARLLELRDGNVVPATDGGVGLPS